jgi:predicted dehydrogenase
MNRLGAGVIGLGIGEQHAAGYRQLDGCELVSLCDQSTDRLAEVALRFPGVRRTTDWRALVADPQVDLVSVASFDDAHVEQAVAALEAGKHVFVEKPLCRSSAELHQLHATLASRPGLVLASNLVLRAAPVYRWLRNAIAAGQLGDIYAFDGDYLYGRIEKITHGWRKDVVGYSVMQGGGIHVADLMLWLTGQRPVRVSAVGNRLCVRGTEFRSNDFVAATFMFESGMIGRITANFGCVHRHQHVVRVFGTKATFLLDDQGPRLVCTRDPSQPAEPVLLDTLPAAKWDLIPEFLAQVTAGQTVSGRHTDLDTISVCLAADAAVSSGASQEVEYV